jgi:hypothetical protein
MKKATVNVVISISKLGLIISIFRYNGYVENGEVLVLPTNKPLLGYRHQTMRVVNSGQRVSENYKFQQKTV